MSRDVVERHSQYLPINQVDSDAINTFDPKAFNLFELHYLVT